ncbi:MAG: helix-turn-helix domain-containing protein [Planctomycetes bacterium]|nr:helix-turn-helix domain-containing protein [Planctomycetota bacterium]
MKIHMEPLVTVEEISKILGLTPDTVRKKCRERKIPCYKICGFYKFKLSEIQEWIEKKKKQVIEMSRLRVSKKLFY